MWAPHCLTLRAGGVRCRATLFKARAQRWVVENDVDVLAARIRIVVMRAYPLELRASLLKIFLFGCCASARFKAAVRPSIAMGRPMSRRTNYFECTRALRSSGGGCWLTPLATTAWCRGRRERPARAALTCGDLLGARHANRDGSALRAESLFFARFKGFRRRYPSTRQLECRTVEVEVEGVQFF